MAEQPLTPEEIAAAGADCFAPPADPCECYCLHCQRVVDSAGMWYQPVRNAADPSGFWRCPTSNCGGAGFTFDIFPTDPDHPGNAGWSYDDDEDAYDPDLDEDSNDPAAEYDPAEPHFADGDPDGDPDDDPDAFAGEEWKHGLQPGERPPESPAAAAGRAEWEAEQRQFDEPDRRPRWIDGSHRAGGRDDPATPDAVIGEDDIPF